MWKVLDDDNNNFHNDQISIRKLTRAFSLGELTNIINKMTCWLRQQYKQNDTFYYYMLLYQ